MKGYLGEIKLVALRKPPKGWVFCYGQFLNKEKYPDLANLIFSLSQKTGNLFALPNLSKTQDVCRYIICIEGEIPDYGE